VDIPYERNAIQKIIEMERSGNTARSSVVHTEDALRYSVLQTDLINNRYEWVGPLDSISWE